MKLLVNNVEQVQPYDLNETLIKLHCRHPDGEYEEVTVRGFRPYFYALRHEVEVQEDWYLAQDSIEEIDYGDYDGFNIDQELARIYVPYPQDTREARELFDEHYAADVPFTRRFRIDTGVRDVIEVPGNDVHWTEIKALDGTSGGSNPTPNGGKTAFQNTEPRVVTLDIEADDSNGFPEPRSDDVLSIAAHDNYTDEYFVWMFTGGRDIEGWLDPSEVDEVETVYLHPTQQQLLSDFAAWVDDVNPDILTGWNSDDFDLPYIIDRMEAVGAPAERLARDGWLSSDGRDGPRIKGRTAYDMMKVYDANHHTELRSYALDDIAAEELDAKKVEFEGSYRGLWENDPETFLEYNIHDVRLTVGINREAQVIKFRDTLRRQVGVDFEDSYDNKDFVDMMVRRKLKEWELVPPSRPDYGDEPESDFEGAYVFDPFEGVAENVGALDLASLYPYGMAMLNASPETKVSADYDGPTARAENGQHFALDQRGLFPSLADDAIGLKAEYKSELRKARGSEDEEFWEIQYGTAKTITNSLYGVTGWARFFLYDEDVAEGITLTSQRVVRTTAENVPHDVVYGDTDSVYISFPTEWSGQRCVEQGIHIQDHLNNSVYPDLAESFGVPREDNLWEIEFEALMSRYFQAGKKKRYAYVAIWKDGEWIDEPKPTIVGFEFRRSDTAQITADLQEDIFEEILLGDVDNITTLIFEASQEVTADDPDYEHIGIPQGLQQKIDPEHEGDDGFYAFSKKGNYPQDAHPRAAWNSNHILGTDFGDGDKPKRVYIEPEYIEALGREINVVAFDTNADLEPLQPLSLDVSRMLQTVIVNPLASIVEVVDVDAEAAVKGQKQTGLGAW